VSAGLDTLDSSPEHSACLVVTTPPGGAVAASHVIFWLNSPLKNGVAVLLRSAKPLVPSAIQRLTEPLLHRRGLFQRAVNLIHYPYSAKPNTLCVQLFWSPVSSVYGGLNTRSVENPVAEVLIDLIGDGQVSRCVMVILCLTSQPAKA
jgi:hypothetical protein